MAGRRTKRLAMVLAGTKILFLVLLAGVWFTAQTPWARDGLLALAQKEIAAQTGMHLKVGRARGRLTGVLVLNNVELTHKGRSLLKAAEMVMEPDWLALMGGRLALKRLVMRSPQVWLHNGALGRPSGGEDFRLEFFRAFSIAEVWISGGSLDPGGAWHEVKGLESMELRGALDWSGSGLDVSLEKASASLHWGRHKKPARLQIRARLRGERLKVSALTMSQGPNYLGFAGEVSMQGELGFSGVVRLLIAEPALLPPQLGLDRLPPVDLNATVGGTLAQISLQGPVLLGSQKVELKGQGNLRAGQGRVDLSLKEFDLAGLKLGLPATRLQGKAKIGFSGLPGGEDFRADTKLVLSSGHVKSLAFKSLRIWGEADSTYLRLASFVWEGDWGRLSGEGAFSWVPKPASAPLSARLVLDGITPPGELQQLLPTFLREMRLNGSLEIKGELDSLGISLVLGPSALAPGLDVEEILAQGSWGGEGGLRLTRFSARGSWGGLDGRGLLSPDTNDLVVQGQFPSLERLAPLLRVQGTLGPPEWKGDVRVQGRLSGPWSRLALNAQVKGSGLALWGVRSPQASLSLALAVQGSVPTGKLSLRASTIHWSGPDLNDFHLQAQSRGQGWETFLETLAGKWAVSAALIGPGPLFRTGSQSIKLLRLEAKPPGQEPWRLEAPAILGIRKDGWAMSSLCMAREGERLCLMELAAAGQGSFKALLEARGVRPESWLEPGRLSPEARLDGQINISGPWQHPQGNLEIRLAGLNKPPSPEASLWLQGGFGRDRLLLRGVVQHGPLAVLDLEADLGWELSLHPWHFQTGEIRARAQASKLPLRLLSPLFSGGEGLRGTARLDLDVRGRLSKPTLRGKVQIVDASIIVGALEQVFKGVNLEAQLDNRRVRLIKAEMKSEGSLRLSGWFDLPTGEEGAADLKLEADDFRIFLGSHGQAVTGAEVTCRGPLEALLISGKVVPTKIKLLVNPDTPPEAKDLVFLEPGDAPPQVGSGQKTSWRWSPRLGPLAGAKVDVRLILGTRLRMELNDGWLDIAGGLRVSKEPMGALLFHDTVEVQRGRLLYHGKRFTVTRGRLNFGGKDNPDAAVSGEIALRNPRYKINVAISGNLTGPELQLSSDPPMSERDILSTILFGRPAADLAKAENKALSAQALALVGQATAEQAEELVGPALTPDVVTFRNSPGQGTALEAGKYIGTDVYFSYRHNIGPQGGQSVGLEYQINDFISLETQAGNFGDTGMDLVFNIDFDLFSHEELEPPLLPAPPQVSPGSSLSPPEAWPEREQGGKEPK